MLLSDRRRGLIYFCLAGMEIAWITPFVALLFHLQGQGSSPMVVFGRLFAVLLVWMLALEFLNRLRVDSPGYELTVLGLIVLSSLLLVRFWLYGGAPVRDFGWLRNTLDALFNFHQGLRPELVLILSSLLLWQRAASATSRSLGFFSVGVSFRLGILLLILGAWLLSHVTGENVTTLLWPYLGLGLTAVALARMHEKAASAPSAGRLLPLPRLAQLLAAVGLTVGGIAWLSLLYTPARIKMALGATRVHIMGQIIFESILITAMGGSCGFLVAKLFERGFPRLGLGEYVGDPIIAANAVIATIAIIGTIGFLAGLFPARRASRLNPVEALRL